jgi:DNA primase (bacterial type)
LPLLPREKIDDVRDRTNIVDVVRRYVELKRAGTGSWKGLCPFHAEKTPSFNVHEQRQYFHCFGCGEKGDVFSFLVKIEQRSFMEVLRDLARQAGVDLPEVKQSPAERQAAVEAESERERMLRVMDAATSFFEAQLAGPAGGAARAYWRSGAFPRRCGPVFAWAMRRQPGTRCRSILPRCKSPAPWRSNWAWWAPTSVDDTISFAIA